MFSFINNFNRFFKISVGEQEPTPPEEPDITVNDVILTETGIPILNEEGTYLRKENN